MSTPLSRRHVLRGAGVALALPWLDAMIPSWAARVSAAPAAKAPPLRLGFVYVPNGVHLPAWTPATEGAAYEMPTILGPLAPWRDRMLVLSGLATGRTGGTKVTLTRESPIASTKAACVLSTVSPGKIRQLTLAAAR